MGISLYFQVSSSGKPANCGALLCGADECVRRYAALPATRVRIVLFQSTRLTRLFIAYGFLTIHHHQL